MNDDKFTIDDSPFTLLVCNVGILLQIKVPKRLSLRNFLFYL